MRTRKIMGLIVVILLFSILIYFLNTRFWIDKYEMKGETLRFKNNVYVLKDTYSETDADNIGNTIGVAINGRRAITDYIWPIWVSEFKDDKEEHNRIFVRGLMDTGSTYIKESN